tara:strand:- start:597 stop:761 length:165 start_codon:yes stop_codon:yes gene_type:complete
MPTIQVDQLPPIPDTSLVSSIMKDKVTHACASFWIEPVTDNGDSDAVDWSVQVD